MQGTRKKSALLAGLLLFFSLFFWELSASTSNTSNPLDAYAALVASEADTARVPPPSQVLALAWDQLSQPFYDRGPNDKGIGTQLLYSLGRVLSGYSLALLVAIPLGFLVGTSATLLGALNPFIQLLKPISPLAWMPLALFVIKDSVASSVFVIFICSLWPVLINTAFGVARVQKDFTNVAKTLELNPLRTAWSITLPAAAPTILTGMRISIGISWLVIVAAEMLVGGTGIGYYVWNEWNNLDLSAVIFSILMIGIVGMLLDWVLAAASRRFNYEV